MKHTEGFLRIIGRDARQSSFSQITRFFLMSLKLLHGSVMTFKFFSGSPSNDQEVGAGRNHSKISALREHFGVNCVAERIILVGSSISISHLEFSELWPLRFGAH